MTINIIAGVVAQHLWNVAVTKNVLTLALSCGLLKIEWIYGMTQALTPIAIAIPSTHNQTPQLLWQLD